MNYRIIILKVKILLRILKVSEKTTFYTLILNQD